MKNFKSRCTQFFFLNKDAHSLTIKILPHNMQDNFFCFPSKKRLKYKWKVFFNSFVFYVILLFLFQQIYPWRLQAVKVKLWTDSQGLSHSMQILQWAWKRPWCYHHIRKTKCNSSPAWARMRIGSTMLRQEWIPSRYSFH